MAVDIDNDTLAAVKAKYDGTPALVTLTGPLRAGRLKSGQPDLYAHQSCEIASRELFGTDGVWSDHRKVTITIVGTKTRASAALAAVLGVFNLNTTLVFPSGATFLRLWPTDGGKLVEDEDTRRGEDIWNASTEFDVWSVR